MSDTFIIISDSLLSIFMTAENFHSSSASDFTGLLVGRLFHRPAFCFIQFKPCFSATAHRTPVLDAVEYVLIMAWPLVLHFDVMTLGESA